MDKYLMGDSLKPWKGGVAQSITFVITQVVLCQDLVQVKMRNFFPF